MKISVLCIGCQETNLSVELDQFGRVSSRTTNMRNGGYLCEPCDDEADKAYERAARRVKRERKLCTCGFSTAPTYSAHEHAASCPAKYGVKE